MFTLFEKTARTVLPNWIYQRLIGDWDKEGLQKYSIQTSWFFIAKIFSFILSFFMVALVARYLGPENLGKLSYAQSFIAIFSVFASLGVGQIVMRDLVAHPEKEHQILGTAFFIKLIAGIVTTIAVSITAFYTSTDSILTWLILIISLTFLIQPFGVSSDVFTARVRGKYTALSQMILTVSIQALKLIIIFSGKGILFFAGILVLEALISVILNLYFYVKVFHHSPFTWYWDNTYAKTLTLASLPLLFVGASSYIFGQIDKVMLQPMISSEAVGLYTSATAITQLVANFAPGIIVGALVPALINAHKTSIEMYYHRLRSLTLLTGSISLVTVLLIFIFAPLIIQVIYGEQFIAAIPILRIFVWSSFLSILMMIASQHLIIINKTKVFLVISIVTAAINIILNYLLIPIFGMAGAATATIISFISYLILVLFSRITRSIS